MLETQVELARRAMRWLQSIVPEDGVVLSFLRYYSDDDEEIAKKLQWQWR
jgi:hypothetical protein